MVLARKEPVPWMSPDIYKAFNEKRIALKRFKTTGDPNDLKYFKSLRNRVNTLIEKSKRTFIKNSLKHTVKNPKKFWRIINRLIKNEKVIDIENIDFLDPDTNEPIMKCDVPDFLNDYFANIANRTRAFNKTNIPTVDLNVNNDDEFNFQPPSIFEIRDSTKEIDITMSSGIENINARMCKTILEIIPDKFLKLFANSVFLGIFPKKWACARLIFLPKDGSNKNPGNWRPISQTNVYSKLLEKIIHVSM